MNFTLISDERLSSCSISAKWVGLGEWPDGVKNGFIGFRLLCRGMKGECSEISLLTRICERYMYEALRYYNSIYDLRNILPIIIMIWSKMAQLGLEESSEVEGFRIPK